MKKLFILCLILSGCGGGPEEIKTFGPQGGQGLPGSNGSDGVDGKDGSQGPTGVQGASGSNGSNGSNGENSLISAVAANAIQCPTGGTVIKAGLDVNKNNVLDPSEVSSTAVICNGLVGATGAAGLNGTIITPVKFCSQSPSYPTTFPEYGLCINNNLYAVYSANDGFLTLIPPGVYSSNAIGSACSFTVLANCKIQ